MGQHDILLRPGRTGDGVALYAVTAASVRGLAVKHYSPEQIDNWFGSRTEVWHENLLSSGQTMVAEHNGRMVGFVHALPGEINRLFVLPEVSGKGLGTRLLQIGLQIASQNPIGPVEVVSLLNAVDFYKRHGFRILETGIYLPEVARGSEELVRMER